MLPSLAVVVNGQASHRPRVGGGSQRGARRWTCALLGLCALALVPVGASAVTPTVDSTSPWADPAWLPEGWRARETTALGESGLGTIPSLKGRAPGRVVLAAETSGSDQPGGALFLVEVDAPLEANNSSKEALLLSAPEALRHLWGVEVEVRWVDVVQLGGAPTLQLQGRIRRAGKKRHLRLTALPRGKQHLLLVFTWPEDDAGALQVEAERVLLALPRPQGPVEPFWTTSTVASTIVAFVVGLIALVLLGRRRR